jgi:hypothetical protein
VGGDTLWTLDHAMTNGTGVLTMASYQGQLYVGSQTGSAQNSLIEVRSGLGAWSTSDTVAGGVTHYSLALIVFGANLYYVNNVDVRKFDGTSWSSVSTAGSICPSSWISNNVLFFGGGGNAAGAGLISSPDGTVWTTRTGNLSNGSGVGSLSGGGVAVYLVY